MVRGRSALFCFVFVTYISCSVESSSEECVADEQVISCSQQFEDDGEAEAAKVSLLQRPVKPASRRGAVDAATEASESKPQKLSDEETLLERKEQLLLELRAVEDKLHLSHAGGAVAHNAFSSMLKVNMYEVAKNESDPRRATVLGIRDKMMLAEQQQQYPTPVASSCHLGPSQSCPVSGMVMDKSNEVYPGGNTRCILSSSKPYKFHVIPGNADKLMIYFQGGGSCWDEGSLGMRLCSLNAHREAAHGIFDRSNAENPFKSYTIVDISYCSGDAHVGNTARDWRGPNGDKVEQRGYFNARSAVDWALQHFGGKQLNSFIVAGSSAGALAVQAWGKTLLSEFSYTTAAAISDCYVGVFPDGVQGPMLRDWNICGSGLQMSDAARQSCYDGELTIQQHFAETMQEYATVPFATITSKTDEGQMAFYNAVAFSMGLANRLIEPTDFYAKLSEIVDRYSSSSRSNSLVFSTNSGQHTYLPYNTMYRTHVRTTRLSDWLRQLPVLPGSSLGSLCERKAGYGPWDCRCWDHCPVLASETVFIPPS